jgi:hypothetical protein
VIFPTTRKTNRVTSLPQCATHTRVTCRPGAGTHPTTAIGQRTPIGKKSIETKFRIAKSRVLKTHKLIFFNVKFPFCFIVAARENADVLSPAPPLRQ